MGWASFKPVFLHCGDKELSGIHSISCQTNHGELNQSSVESAVAGSAKLTYTQLVIQTGGCQLNILHFYIIFMTLVVNSINTLILLS